MVEKSQETHVSRVFQAFWVVLYLTFKLCIRGLGPDLRK